MGKTHQSIVDKGKDYFLSEDKVMSWIKTNKEKLPELKNAMFRNVKGAIQDYHYCKSYIDQMNYYLRTGTWASDFYGEHQQYKTQWRDIYDR